MIVPTVECHFWCDFGRDVPGVGSPTAPDHPDDGHAVFVGKSEWDCRRQAYKAGWRSKGLKYWGGLYVFCPICSRTA